MLGWGATQTPVEKRKRQRRKRGVDRDTQKFGTEFLDGRIVATLAAVEIAFLLADQTVAAKEFSKADMPIWDCLRRRGSTHAGGERRETTEGVECRSFLCILPG